MLKYEIFRDPEIGIDYRRHGDLHRLNGPASLLDNGHMEWQEYGDFHRLDGPAIITAYGQESFYYKRNKYVNAFYHPGTNCES